MGRRARKPHELTPRRKRTGAFVTYRGVEHYLGTWDVERDEPSAEAQARLAELVAVWRDDPGAARKGRPGDVLLAELWAEWRLSPEVCGRDPRPATRAARHLFGSEDEPTVWADMRATAFRGEELREYQRRLCESKLSRDSVTKLVAAVRACFAWGLIGKRVGWEQYRELELVPPPGRGQCREAVRRKGVTWDTARTAAELLTPPLRTACRLLWLTGARPSEILGLRAGEVVRGGVLVAESGVKVDLDKHGVWAARKSEHKTDGSEAGYDRVIFFGPLAQEVLGPLLVGKKGDELLLSSAGVRGDRPGGQYDYHALTTAVRRACARVRAADPKAPTWTPYSLRHAVGVEVQQSHGREAARVFLGHQVGGVTERYAGKDLELAARVAAERG
jgi:integrase